MNGRIITDIPLDDLVKILVAELAKHFEKPRPNPEKLFTRSEVARKLVKSYNTIDRMILQKRIKTTSDGKYISQQAIDDYINSL